MSVREQLTAVLARARWTWTIWLTLLVLCAGCGVRTAPCPFAAEAAGRNWLDAVVPSGQQIVFGSASVRLTLARHADRVVFTIKPALWPVPRLGFQADSPDAAALGFSARWSELTYATGLQRPYRIVVHYPAGGYAATRPDHEGAQLGRVDYFMPSRPPDQPHEMGFSPDMVAYTSPLHLVLMALGPLPTGQTRVLAVHKSGVDYWATIDAADGRRELRFPRALLWSDLSDRQLADQCVFRVESIRDWPATRIQMENFSRLDGKPVSFLRVGPADEAP